MDIYSHLFFLSGNCFKYVIVHLDMFIQIWKFNQILMIDDQFIKNIYIKVSTN